MNENYKIEFRFWISYKGESLFGHGKIDLLLKNKELGSLRKAAEELGISYRKAYYNIDSVNKIAEKPIVEMKRGGKDGGTTKLTPYGETLIQKYCELQKEIEEFIASKTFK